MKEVTIEGQKYPVTFGLKAVEILAEKYNITLVKDFDQLIKNLAIADIPIFVAACVENGCIVERKPKPTTEQIRRTLDKDLSVLFETMAVLSIEQNEDGSFSAVKNKTETTPKPMVGNLLFDDL